MHRIRRVTLGVTLVAALAVAGCSNNSGDGSSSATSGTGAGGATTTPSRSDFNQPFVAGTPKVGGAITVGVEANIASLDPAGAIAQVSDFDTALAIYDPLVDVGPKGDYVASLATRWSNSPDLKTWTITLRTGVTFSDGTPFNADAVVKHFQRLKDPATKCVCATEVALITGVEATGPSTVVFTLKQPNAFFVDSLTGAIGLIASPTATAKWGADYGRNPVGTGPFTLKTYDPIVLQKNPTYWKKDGQGRRLPYLDQVTVRPIPESSIRLDSLKAGNIDVMQVADTGTIVDAIAAKKFTVQKITGSSSLSISFNNRKPPFDDVRLRRAVAMAVDRNEINSILYKGARQQAWSQFATTSPYYAADAGWLKYDPTAARKLVAAAKADGSPTRFTFTCVATEESRQLLTIVKRQIAAVGLTAELEFVDQGAYVNKLLGANHDFTAGCTRNGENPTPDLYEGWYSTGSFNAEGFNNRTADAAMVEIRKTTDQKKLVRLARDLQVQLAKDVPAFPLLYDLFANVANDKVSGLPVPEPTFLGAITFSSLYLKA